jgi:large repetitive protein
VVLPIEVSFEVNQLVTPNGDGVNDTWQLTHIERFKDNKVVLMDRWGGVVYEASGYNNENIAWKGSNSNGTQLPAGTYFYSITVQFNEQEVKRKGFIELIW